MSKRNRRQRANTPRDALSGLADQLDGQRIPGGCDDCSAYQVLGPSDHPGVFVLTVFHDDNCPTLRGVTR